MPGRALKTDNSLQRDGPTIHRSRSAAPSVGRRVPLWDHQRTAFNGRSKDASGLSLSACIQPRRSAGRPSMGKGIQMQPQLVATILLAAALISGVLYHYSSRPPAASNKWEQLTFFTDSAVYPAFSPDRGMLSFIRGSGTFLTAGQVYVKLLPGGEPVELTHDSRIKLSPVFSPDGSGIAYRTANPWETWEVPVLGGEPRLLLPNASSLTWIENGKRLLFSEIKKGMHMTVVTTDEGRGQA